MIKRAFYRQVLRIAFRFLIRLYDRQASYETLERYGIEDLLWNQGRGEFMIVIDRNARLWE